MDVAIKLTSSENKKIKNDLMASQTTIASLEAKLRQQTSSNQLLSSSAVNRTKRSVTIETEPVALLEIASDLKVDIAVKAKTIDLMLTQQKETKEERKQQQEREDALRKSQQEREDQWRNKQQDSEAAARDAYLSVIKASLEKR